MTKEDNKKYAIYLLQKAANLMSLEKQDMKYNQEVNKKVALIKDIITKSINEKSTQFTSFSLS